MTTIGMYLYGWYDASKWRGHGSFLTPLVGFYESRKSELIYWQVENIKRTGVDYVIFEMVGLDDPSFLSIVEHAEISIPALNKNGIGYTFFIDFGVFDRNKCPVDEYKKVISYLKKRMWIDNIYNNQTLGQAIYLFSPWPDLIDRIDAETPTGCRAYSSLWSPTWGLIIEDEWPYEVRKLFCRYWLPCVKSNTALSSELEKMGYFPFWQPTEQLECMNGIASVIPGYDDLLLKREPQLAPVVPRQDGHTLVDQFKRAVDTGAENILIYGWNEYFEATTIEPTLEYGDFYLELTKRLIAQVKRGETIHFPKDMGKPERVAPIYLAPELERAAQRYPDKVPRWDQDDYLAEIAVPQPATHEADEIVFQGVQVINIGQKAWSIASKQEPIRLGARLIDESGNVVREGRAEFGRNVEVGDKIEIDLKVDIAGLQQQSYIAKIDMVWEGRFWFESSFYARRIALN